MAPDNCLIVRGVVHPLCEEITTGQAAKILHKHPGTVSAMCDQGRLVEGKDWRRIGDHGWYLLRLDSILALAKIQTNHRHA